MRDLFNFLDPPVDVLLLLNLDASGDILFLNLIIAKKEKRDTSGPCLNGQIQAPYVRLVAEEGIAVGDFW